MPHMPTAPVHHGWAASHSTASYPSRVSASVYSSRATPADDPVPRTSSRHRAKPRAASHSPRRVSAFAAPVVLAVRDHLEDRREPLVGSSAAGAGQPQVGRQLEAVADRDPDVPVDSTSWRGGLAGRPSVGSAVIAASLRAAARAADGRRPRHATIAAMDDDRRSPSGPWIAPLAPASAYENPGSRSGTTRSPGRTAARDLRRGPLREPGGRASWPSTTTTGSLLVGQHRYTLDAYSWEIPEGGVPVDEDPLDGRPARAARGDRRRRRRLARARPARTCRTR